VGSEALAQVAMRLRDAIRRASQEDIRPARASVGDERVVDAEFEDVDDPKRRALDEESQCWVDGPDGIIVPNWPVMNSGSKGDRPFMHATMIGLDIAKTVFQVYGEDSEARAVCASRLSARRWFETMLRQEALRATGKWRSDCQRPTLRAGHRLPDLVILGQRIPITPPDWRPRRMSSSLQQAGARRAFAADARPDRRECAGRLERQPRKPGGRCRTRCRCEECRARHLLVGRPRKMLT